MNPAWGPTLVSGFVMLLGLAAAWGMLRQSNNNLVQKVTEIKTDLTGAVNSAESRVNKRIDDVEKDCDDHKKAIWPRLGAVETKVAKIQGKLGINGGGD